MIEFLNKLAYLSSFFTIGNVLGVSSILIAVLIAIWQFCVAQRAQAKLESIVKTLPHELLNSVKSFVEQPNEPANEILSKDYGLSAKMADLEGDGEDELLISSPFGPHGSRLQVFGFREWEFQKIDEITVMAPSVKAEMSTPLTAHCPAVTVAVRVRLAVPSLNATVTDCPSGKTAEPLTSNALDSAALMMPSSLMIV